MKLYIPKVGDKIKLTKSLSVTIKAEYRNNVFIKSYMDKYPEAQLDGDNNLPILIPAGVNLVFSRIYIRQGESSSYDSITFTTDGKSGFIRGRFFIPIENANHIEYEKSNTELKLVKLKKAIKIAFEEEYKKDAERILSHFTIENKAYENVMKDTPKNLSITLYFNYKKAFESINQDLDPVNEYNFHQITEIRERLNHEQEKLQDDILPLMEIDFHLYNGDYAMKIKRINEFSNDFICAFYDAMEFVKFRNKKFIYKQSLALNRMPEGWEEYDYLKNIMLEPDQHISKDLLNFGEYTNASLKSKLTSLKREVTKAKKQANGLT